MILKNKNKKKPNGFTIMELMVVLSIMIFVLSSALSAVTTARRLARNDKRKSDLKQLQAALTLYHIDNARYPADMDPTVPCSGSPTFISSDTSLKPLLVPKYLSKMPMDPLGSSGSAFVAPVDYQYVCLDEGSEYAILISFNNEFKGRACRIAEPLSSTLFNSYPFCE